MQQVWIRRPGSHVFDHAGKVTTPNGAMFAAEAWLDKNPAESPSQILIVRGGEAFLLDVVTPAPPKRWVTGAKR